MRIEVQLLHVYNMFALHSISYNTLLVFNYRVRRSFLKGGGGVGAKLHRLLKSKQTIPNFDNDQNA